MAGGRRGLPPLVGQRRQPAVQRPAPPGAGADGHRHHVRASPPSCWRWPTAAGCSPTTTRCRTTSRTASSGASGLADKEVVDEETAHDRPLRDAAVNALARAPDPAAAPRRRGVDPRRAGPAPLQRVIGVAVLSTVIVLSIVLLVEVDRDGIVVGPGRRLAGPDRHHPRRRPLLGRSCSCVASVMLLAVLVYAIGQPGAERNHVGLPVRVPRAGRRRRGVVPHRRPVQPVRRLRDDADGQLRADHPRRPRATRCASGMTYVVISLVASTLFVTALALIYSATGTVNMADLVGEAGRAARPGVQQRLRRAAARGVRHQGRRCSRCSSGCPTATRPRRRRSPRCSPACSPRSACTPSSAPRRCCSPSTPGRPR